MMAKNNKFQIKIPLSIVLERGIQGQKITARAGR